MQKPKCNNQTTALLTALHATVDALCACSVFMIAPGVEASDYVLLFVLYNCMAFTTQPLVGLWFDKRRALPLHLIAAVVLLVTGGGLAAAGGLGFLGVSPFAVAALVGAGNSIFHVYGGKVVAIETDNDLRHLGIFVSSGALGLALGGIYCSAAALLLIIGLLLVLTGLYLYIHTDNICEQGYNGDSCPPILSSSKAFIAFLLLIVFARSFIGSLSPGSTASDIPYYSTLAVAFAVLGKASGGFIARWLGVWQTLTLTLLLAGICFLMGYYHALFMLAMVLFINGSMPLTLHLSNRALPGREGLSFGLLAAMLAPGVGLAVLCAEDAAITELLYPLVATIVIEALVLLLLRENRWQVLAISVVMNILTNIPLNLYATSVNELTVPMICLLEALVAVVECGFFFLVTRDIRRSFLYSIVCNLCSLLLGVLYALLF